MGDGLRSKMETVRKLKEEEEDNEFRLQKPEDLLEIGKYNYYACNYSTSSKQYKNSPAIAFMLVPGDYFFKSGNYGSCINAQKLYENVAAPIEDDTADKI
ncbi:hypothetical protein H5410_056696 [Solanum commersonii]|uniref:Uncharacterized protein n=1 Tax=Solanum commersonii TaxID=4109 RepID=A0A9J5WM24_SOLCO|nr:hypothetical protein H5410_056696 [Solanum commersonii]